MAFFLFCNTKEYVYTTENTVPHVATIGVQAHVEDMTNFERFGPADLSEVRCHIEFNGVEFY